jgi:hypothetical protein
MANFLNNVTVNSELGTTNSLNGSSNKPTNNSSYASSLKTGSPQSQVAPKKQSTQGQTPPKNQKEQAANKQNQENMSSIDNEKFELLLTRLNTVQPDNVRQDDLDIFRFVKQNWDNFTREQKDKLHQNRIALAFIFNPQKELKIQHEENQDIVARDIEQTNTICSADPRFTSEDFKIKEDNNENVIKDEKGHLLFLKDLVESLDQITADEISGEKSGNYNFPNEKVYVFANKEEDEDFYYCLYPSFAYSDKQLVIRIEYEKGKLPEGSDAIVTEKKDKKLITTYFKYDMKKIKFMLENLNEFWKTAFKDPKKIFVDLFNDVLTEQGSFKEKYDEEKVGIVTKRQEIAKVFKENITKELNRNFEAPEERAEDLFDYHIYTTLKIPIKKQGENETDEEYGGRKEKAEAQEQALFSDNKNYHFILKTELKDGKLTIEEEPKYASWDKEKTEKGLKRLLDLNKNKNISYELIEISSYNDLVRLNDQLKTTKENLQFNLDKIKDLKLEDILKEIDKVVPEKDALTLLRDTIPGYDFLQTRSLKSNLSVIEDIKKFIEYFNEKIKNEKFKSHTASGKFTHLDKSLKNFNLNHVYRLDSQNNLLQLFINIFYKKILESIQSILNELTKYSKEYAKEMLESVYQEALRSNDKKFQTAKKAEIEEAKEFVKGIFADLANLQVDIDENLSNVESHLTSDQSLSKSKEDWDTQEILGKEIYNQGEVLDIITNEDSTSLNDEFNSNKKLLDDLKEYTEIIERKTNSNIHIIDLTNEADYETFKAKIKETAKLGENKFYLIKRRRHEDSTHQNKILLQFVMTFRKKVFYKEIKDLKDILSNIKSMLSLVKKNVDNNSKDLVERKFKYAQRRFENFINNLFDEFDEKRVKQKLDAIDPDDYEKKREFLTEKYTQNLNFRDAISQFISKKEFHFRNDISENRSNQSYEKDYVFFQLKKKLEDSSDDEGICKLSFFFKEDYEKDVKKEYTYKFSIPKNTDGVFDNSKNIKETMFDISFDNNLLKASLSGDNPTNENLEHLGDNHVIIVKSFRELFLKPSINFIESKLNELDENSKKYEEYNKGIKIPEIPEINFDDENTIAELEPDEQNTNTERDQSSHTVKNDQSQKSNQPNIDETQKPQNFDDLNDNNIKEYDNRYSFSKKIDDSKSDTALFKIVFDMAFLDSKITRQEIDDIINKLNNFKKKMINISIDEILNERYITEHIRNNNSGTPIKVRFGINGPQKLSYVGLIIGSKLYEFFEFKFDESCLNDTTSKDKLLKDSLEILDLLFQKFISKLEEMKSSAPSKLDSKQKEKEKEKTNSKDDIKSKEETSPSTNQEKLPDSFDNLNPDNLKKYNPEIKDFINFIKNEDRFKQQLKDIYLEINNEGKFNKYIQKLNNIEKSLITPDEDNKKVDINIKENIDDATNINGISTKILIVYSDANNSSYCQFKLSNDTSIDLFQIDFADNAKNKSIYNMTIEVFKLLKNKIVKNLKEIYDNATEEANNTTNNNDANKKDKVAPLQIDNIENQENQQPKKEQRSDEKGKTEKPQKFSEINSENITSFNPEGKNIFKNDNRFAFLYSPGIVERLAKVFIRKEIYEKNNLIKDLIEKLTKEKIEKETSGNFKIKNSLDDGSNITISFLSNSNNTNLSPNIYAYFNFNEDTFNFMIELDDKFKTSFDSSIATSVIQSIFEILKLLDKQAKELISTEETKSKLIQDIEKEDKQKQGKEESERKKKEEEEKKEREEQKDNIKKSIAMLDTFIPDVRSGLGKDISISYNNNHYAVSDIVRDDSNIKKVKISFINLIKNSQYFMETLKNLRTSCRSFKDDRKNESYNDDNDPTIEYEWYDKFKKKNEKDTFIEIFYFITPSKEKGKSLLVAFYLHLDLKEKKGVDAEFNFLYLDDVSSEEFVHKKTENVIKSIISINSNKAFPLLTFKKTDGFETAFLDIENSSSQEKEVDKQNILTSFFKKIKQKLAISFVNTLITGLGDLPQNINTGIELENLFEGNKSLLKILGQKLILEEIQKDQSESSHLDFSYFKSQKKEIQSLIKQYEKEEDNKVKKSIEKKIRQKQKEISNQISLQSIKNFVNNIKSLRNANNENSQTLVKQMGKRLGFEPSPLEFSLQSLNKFKNMAEFSRVISNIVLTNIMLQLTQLNTIYTIFSNDQIDENVIRDSFMQLENDFKRLVKSLQEKEVTKKFEDLSSKIEENFGADSSVYLETKDTYERVMSYYQKQFKSLNDFKQSLSEFWENYSKIEKEEEKINERKNMISQFIEIRDSKEIKQIYKIYLVNNSFFNEKLQGIISENSKLSYNEILTSHGYETFESIYQKEKQIFDKTFKKCNEVLGKALGQGRLGKLFDDLEKIKTNLENTKVKPKEEQKQGQEKEEENTQNTQVKQKTVSNKNTKPEQENKQDKTEETSGNKTESKKIKQGLKLLNNDTQLKIYQRKN